MADINDGVMTSKFRAFCLWLVIIIGWLFAVITWIPTLGHSTNWITKLKDYCKGEGWIGYDGKGYWIYW